MCRSDHYSGQSSNTKESCSSTPLNRCTIIIIIIIIIISFELGACHEEVGDDKLTTSWTSPWQVGEEFDDKSTSLQQIVSCRGRCNMSIRQAQLLCPRGTQTKVVVKCLDIIKYHIGYVKVWNEAGIEA